MKDLGSHLAKTIHAYVLEEGMQDSPVPGARCIKISQVGRRSKNHWKACLGIVAQGCKEVVLGRDLFRCEDASYIVSAVDLPVVSRVASATPERPFLSLLIQLDPLVLNEVAAQMEKDSPEENAVPLRAMYGGKASDPMLEAAIRLLRVFRNPDDAAVLGPLIVREIFYHLLKGPEGLAIRQFVRSGSKMHKISQAIYRLKSELQNEVDTAALAKTARMSRSAFFRHFKDVTAMSPIQYQKRLRLLEARRLMSEEGESAESAAFRVGYKSPSQFSREYSRMFGASPLRDVKKLQKSQASFDLTYASV